MADCAPISKMEMARLAAILAAITGCGRVSDDTDPRIDWLLDSVGAELSRALTKFPAFNSPHEGYAVIREELEHELWQHVCENTGYTEHAMEEAIQTAAMALRYVYDLADWGPR